MEEPGCGQDLLVVMGEVAFAAALSAGRSIRVLQVARIALGLLYIGAGALVNAVFLPTGADTAHFHVRIREDIEVNGKLSRTYTGRCIKRLICALVGGARTTLSARAQRDLIFVDLSGRDRPFGHPVSIQLPHLERRSGKSASAGAQILSLDSHPDFCRVRNELVDLAPDHADASKMAAAAHPAGATNVRWTRTLALVAPVSENPTGHLCEIRDVVEIDTRPGLSEAAFQPGTGPRPRHH